MRGFLQALIPFLVPFALYFGWVWLSRRTAVVSMTSVPWLVLSVAGVMLAAAALLWFAETTALDDDGLYAPARIENGRIIDGGTRPAGP